MHIPKDFQFLYGFLIVNVYNAALLTEIKEINERKLKEDNVLLAIAAGNQLPIFPNMQFEYSDSDVHEDLYKIVKYSCGEVCTSDQFDKVMRIWTNFVEPFLGVPPRVQGAEDAVDVVRSKGSAVKSNSASTRENKGCGSDDAVGNTKQLKPIRHADANSLGEHGDLQKTILVDSVRTTGGPAFHDVHCVVVGDDNPCSSPCNGKVQGAAVADGTPLFSRQASAGQLMDDASITARAEEIQVRASHDIASGVFFVWVAFILITIFLEGFATWVYQICSSTPIFLQINVFDGSTLNKY